MAEDRRYLLERVDEAAVVQVYADAFADLPLKEKTLVWHLYQAALAGRRTTAEERLLLLIRTLMTAFSLPAAHAASLPDWECTQRSTAAPPRAFLPMEINLLSGSSPPARAAPSLTSSGGWPP